MSDSRSRPRLVPFTRVRRAAWLVASLVVLGAAANVAVFTPRPAIAASHGGTCDARESAAEQAAWELRWDGPDVWVGENPSHALRLRVDEAGLSLDSVPERDRLPWQWRLDLRAPAGPTPVNGDRVDLRVSGRRVDVRHPEISEWYLNGRKGLQHGLDVEVGPAPGPMRLAFTLAGTLTAKVRDDGRSVAFVDAAGTPVLVYGGLHAIDAEGRDVDVRWDRPTIGGDGGTVLALALAADSRRGPIHVLGVIVRAKDPLRGDDLTAADLAGTTASDLTGTPAPEVAGTPRPAVAPSNDLCGGAAVVPGAGPFPFTSAAYDVTDATLTGDPPSNGCQPDVSRSAWFRFTPAATSYYSFSLCADAPSLTTLPDTVLALYTGNANCGNLSLVAGGCDDDSCSNGDLQSIVTGHQLTAGQNYYLVAWKFGAAAPAAGEATVQLVVTKDNPPPAAPANDQCPGAELIPPAGPFPYQTSLLPDISSATLNGDPAPPTCQPNVSRSVWYSFTPASTGSYSFSLCADAPTGTTVDDTVLAIYSSAGVCTGLSELAGGCADDTCTLALGQSSITGATLTAGNTYYVVAWKFDATAPLPGHTAVQMRVTQTLGPSNDTCAGAIPITPNVPVAGTTAGAADNYELSGSACFTGIGQTSTAATGGDVVYRFTAPAAGAWSFRVSPGDPTKNVVLYVATTCPGGPFPAIVGGCLGAANRSTGNPAEEVACLPLAAGQTVQVFVDESGPTMGTPFTLEVTPCTAETEPNGTPPAAGPLACGIEGSIAPAGDVDFFSLGSPPAGSRVFALVDGAATNLPDLDLRVTTAADTLEYDDLNNDVPFGATSPNIAGTPLTGEAAFLDVVHFSVLQQSEPYHLYAFVEPPAGTIAEVEPNNSTGSATSGASLSWSGALSATTDVDHFAFQAITGDLIQIGLDLDPTRTNTPWNGILTLLDSSGATLLSVNDSAATSNPTTGAGSLTSKTPTSPAEGLLYRARAGGVYYARVAYGTGTPGDYLLAVALNCRIGPAANLGVSLTDAPDPVAPGQPITYTITVNNSGVTPGQNVTLRDDLPAGVGFVSATPSQGSCSGTGPIQCALGNIGGVFSVTVTVVVTAPGTPGTLVNRVAITSASIDASPADDSAEATTTVGAADGDGDGVPDAADCAPGDPAAWAVPGEATGLVFPTPGNTAALQWTAPADPGGSQVRYDLLRSTAKNDFSAATCVASGITATSAIDATPPTAALYYLVRARNACGGNLGAGTNGVPRTGTACP